MLAVTPPDDSPEALLARVAAGDRGAFATLARKLHAPGLRIAHKVLRTADAEDALQAAFLKLWTRATQFDPARGSVEAWFGRIVVRACLDRRRTIRVASPLDAVAEAPCPAPGADVRAETSDEAARIDRAVARLNPRQRAAILLFYGEEATTTEVAEALETTPKAVEGLLARARVELARNLSDMRATR